MTNVVTLDEAVRRQHEEMPPPMDPGWEGDPVGSPKLFPIELSDAINFDLESEDLIDGILPKVGVAMVYGKPATLKSFICFDWAGAIIKGDEWGGRRVEK